MANEDDDLVPMIVRKLVIECPGCHDQQTIKDQSEGKAAESQADFRERHQPCLDEMVAEQAREGRQGKLDADR